jgi:polyisoprenoid-binding protein YceI
VTAPLLAAGAWTVSDSRTRVTFSVGNLGKQAHGSVSCSWGDLRLDAEGCPIAARAELDLNSLDTGIAKRDADLRKPRLLDIDRHPTMTWSADRFTPADDGSWTAEGTLCVRGTAAALIVVGTAEVDGSWLRVRARGELDRRSVGIRAPSLLIGRTVTIEVEAWLTPAVP